MKEHAEEWKQLCQQASTEQNPKKLLELIRRINELLEEKRKRLNSDSHPQEQEEVKGQ